MKRPLVDKNVSKATSTHAGSRCSRCQTYHIMYGTEPQKLFDIPDMNGLCRAGNTIFKVGGPKHSLFLNVIIFLSKR